MFQWPQRKTPLPALPHTLPQTHSHTHTHTHSHTHTYIHPSLSKSVYSRLVRVFFPALQKRGGKIRVCVCVCVCECVGVFVLCCVRMRNRMTYADTTPH